MSLPGRVYKTRAIVLRSHNLGEADRIYTLLTQARGKLDAVGKGVRRPKSHLAGRLEFLTETLLTLHRGRNLDVITGTDMVHSTWSALVRPHAFGAASVIAELTDAFCEPDLPVPDIYELVRGAVRGLARAADPSALIPRFQLRLLYALGLAPPSDACVRCAGPFVDGEAWADVDAGGLSCAACRPHHADAFGLSARDLDGFRALAAPRALATKEALRPTPATARAIDAFITYHLGKRPKAAGVLSLLAQVPAAATP
ncbi:MAG: DNA repair protein RecO [Candidatus Eremiobacteraeota bacterium]|nr:DNA repair protein RecO [Candidatus Eremiobacteraeota bacterium]MBV9646882.1 DNA repair protein RecO [Candidatus Eremiobacteraeota bacterium]